MGIGEGALWLLRHPDGLISSGQERSDRTALGLWTVVARSAILAFAERVLPSASNLWVQSSVAQKQRLQQQFFPDGTRFDGKKIVGTGSTLPVFNYLSPISDEKEMVDLTGIEPVTS